MANFVYGGAEPMTMKDSNSTQRMYSNTFMSNKDPFAASSPFNKGMFFINGQRRRMNIVAVLLALFVPWLLFCTVYALLCANIRYRRPNLTFTLVVLAFVCVVGLAIYYAWVAVKKKFFEPTYQPSWYVFIAVTCLVAFILAVVAGEWNFTEYMQRYYDLTNLAEYKDINTNDYLGQQLMDAGRIEFQKGTVLDLQRSMGFKNHDIYCVAPIVTKGTAKDGLSVDFWAVGKNCCSGYTSDFHCSGFSDPMATGVIRMMHDEDRPFYRLAVQQAEATYKMTASHPLFFQWVRNADEATDLFSYNGHFNYFVGIAVYFLVQGFFTAVTALAFAKLIHP